MSEWKTYKLGDFITHKKGFAFKSDFYKDTGSPIIRVTNFTGNSISMDDILFIDMDQKINFKEVEIKEGDIIIATVGSWPNNPSSIVGRVIKVPRVASGTLLNQNAVIIYPNTNLDKKFLYYLLKEKNFSNYLVGGAQGSANQASIKLEQIYNYEFSAPEDKAQQQEIAQILTSLDDKIELNLQMNQTLEAMAQALFKEWFVNFNFPSSELGLEGLNDDRIFYKKGKKENKEILPTSNQQNHNSDNLPKGWRMGKLGDISTNFDNKRVPLSSMQRKDRQGIYPYYGAATIFDYIDDYIFDGTFLLMGEDGTVQTDEGFPLLQYVWGKFWVNNHTHVLQGKIPFSTEYLYLLLSKTNITHLITGAVQPKINQGNMNKIECVLPTVQILNDFQKVIDPIFEKIKSNKIQIQSLTQTRDTLLPKLMSGKIKLSELGLGGLNDDRILVKKTNKEILKSSNPKNHNSDKK